MLDDGILYKQVFISEGSFVRLSKTQQKI